MDAGANPSFLTIHPNGRLLYAVNELEKYNGRPTGAVSAFAIARDTGALTRLNEQSSEGGAPCYVSVDRSGRVALVANYAGGSVALLSIQPDGALAPAAQVVQHTGTGPNAERQAAPHAHCVLADPSNRFVLAADLGADRVFVYRLDLDGKSLRHVDGGDALMRAGAGPRHIAFHPTLPLVFVANELDSTVATLRFDAERGKLSALDTHSTVRIPEREQLDRLAGRNLGQTVWAELRGSRYNLARAREKEYLAGPRGWAEARTNSERASTQTLSGKAYSQR